MKEVCKMLVLPHNLYCENSVVFATLESAYSDFVRTAPLLTSLKNAKTTERQNLALPLSSEGNMTPLTSPLCHNA